MTEYPGSHLHRRFLLHACDKAVILAYLHALSPHMCEYALGGDVVRIVRLPGTACRLDDCSCKWMEEYFSALAAICKARRRLPRRRYSLSGADPLSACRSCQRPRIVFWQSVRSCPHSLRSCHRGLRAGHACHKSHWRCDDQRARRRHHKHLAKRIISPDTNQAMPAMAKAAMVNGRATRSANRTKGVDWRASVTSETMRRYCESAALALARTFDGRRPVQGARQSASPRA